MGEGRGGNRGERFSEMPQNTGKKTYIHPHPVKQWMAQKIMQSELQLS